MGFREARNGENVDIIGGNNYNLGASLSERHRTVFLEAFVLKNAEL